MQLPRSVQGIVMSVAVLRSSGLIIRAVAGEKNFQSNMNTIQQIAARPSRKVQEKFYPAAVHVAVNSTFLSLPRCSVKVL
jgi:hypothetical protein